MGSIVVSRSLTQKPEISSTIALPWIIRMRYGIAAGEIGLMVFANRFLSLHLPLVQMLTIPAVVIVSNVLLSRTSQRHGTAGHTADLVGWVFGLDAVCLTLLLMASGGPSNPFTVLYLVHITLAAAILSARQTWLLGLFSIGCFGLLFRIHHPVPELGGHHMGNLHFVGMWLSFVVAVVLVAIYASKISGLLREHEAARLRMEVELAKKDRLASLVTLAAGAAHELNTPLSTIAVVAKELERSATGDAVSGTATAIREDSRLIRQEVERCREILQRMSDEGAEPAGEPWVRRPAAEFLAELERSFAGGVRVHPATDEELMLNVPVHALVQALRALVKNGLEAMGEKAQAKVEVRAERHAEGMQFVVEDRGCGMSSELMRRVGEPFLTSKPPGSGMGLGVFLARNLAERLGGGLTFESEPGEGTRALFHLPGRCVAQAQGERR